MVRRTTRHFSEADKAALLDAIGQCRAACGKANSVTAINGEVYRASSDLMASIDVLAGILTGKQDHFHTKAHSTTQPGHSS